MFAFEILIVELFPINTLASSSIAVLKITSLKHKFLNQTMEDCSLVMKRFSTNSKPLFSSTKRSEILCCFWHNVLEKLNLNSLWLCWSTLNIKKHNWIWRIGIISWNLFLFLLASFIVFNIEKFTKSVLLFLFLRFEGFINLLKERNHRFILLV